MPTSMGPTVRPSPSTFIRLKAIFAASSVGIMSRLEIPVSFESGYACDRIRSRRVQNQHAFRPRLRARGDHAEELQPPDASLAMSPYPTIRNSSATAAPPLAPCRSGARCQLQATPFLRSHRPSVPAKHVCPPKNRELYTIVPNCRRSAKAA